MTKNDIKIYDDYLVSRAREDFYAYRQYISGFKLKTNWFVQEISKELQQFYVDYQNGLRPKLIIQAPFQHGKSEAIKDIINWIAGKNNDTRFIYASFSERLGIRANLKVQRTMDSAKYKKIFPKTTINTRQTVTNKGYQRNKEMIEFCDADGSFRNTTVRGSITGETLDIGIVDDPIKGREEANSITIRNKTWDWLNDDFFTRFDEFAGFLCILTRWHIDDPIGRLREKDPSIKVLSYKAIAEEDEEYRNEGEALFPEHKSIDFLLSKKASMDSGSWQALAQQNPVIKGGNLIKEDYFNYYNREHITKFDKLCIFADTANKIKESNDYSVFQLWGKKGSNIYLIDQLRGKWESPELVKNAVIFYDKCKAIGRISSFNIEDKSSGIGLIQTLKRESIPIKAIPRNTDKVFRCNNALPFIENGLVYLPNDAHFISDYIAELIMFPSGKHDDQLDPTLDAIEELLYKTTQSYAFFNNIK